MAGSRQKRTGSRLCWEPFFFNDDNGLGRLLTGWFPWFPLKRNDPPKECSIWQRFGGWQSGLGCPVLKVIADPVRQGWQDVLERAAVLLVRVFLVELAGLDPAGLPVIRWPV